MNLQEILKEEHLDAYAILPISLCSVRRPDIITRRGVSADEMRTAILFLIPYYVQDGEGNISLYARSGDYHAYSDALFARIEPLLEKAYGGRFLGFADKSPIEETVAAARAGLGKIGDNYMLIHEKYGSFVFLAELLTTCPPDAFGWQGEESLPKDTECLHCGACKKACPMVRDGMPCLSAVTQKKGELTPEETAYLQKYGSAWGCDLCQLACPMNAKVLREGIETPIDFFKKDRISVLTREALEAMDEEAFRSRSFSWRGKAPLLRNLDILKK